MLILNTVTAVVCTLIPLAHLDQYPLITSTFPVALYFLSRGRKVFFFKKKKLELNSFKTAVN